MITRTIASTLCLLMLASAAWADSRPMPENYAWLGVQLSQYWPYHEEVGPNFIQEITLPGVQVGYRSAADWSILASWQRNDTVFPNTHRGVTVTNRWLSMRYHFSGSTYEPYVGVNVGQLILETDSTRNDEMLVGVEAGLQTRLQPHWVLDLGLRVPKSIGNERVDIQAWLTLKHVFAFGDTNNHRMTPRVETRDTTHADEHNEQRPDGDHDGVPNRLDQCLDTPANARSGARGCTPAS